MYKMNWKKKSSRVTNPGRCIEGVRFLLSHFHAARQQLFPRKMSTSVSDGKQFTVWTKEQILQECEKARVGNH